MMFDMPRIPSKLKIGYNIEKIEEFLPRPFRCYKGIWAPQGEL